MSEQVKKRTLWDWTQLLLLPILLIALASALGIQQYQQAQAIAQQARQQQVTMLRIAAMQQQDSILTTYTGSISDMLLHSKLLHSSPIDDVRVAAQADTLTTLQRLDPAHKGMLLRYLFQTKLINNDFQIINLREADLRGALLHNVDLRDTYLYGADLRGADISGADLSYATLVFTNMAGANMTATDLHGSDMRGADVSGSNLKGANLQDAQNTRDDQLTKAKSLAAATMPDGATHP
jgi:uncharacterized protein YjbI with pentapeptide repeats